MTVIRLQQQEAAEHQGANLVSFDHGIEYPVQIHDPFANTPEQEEDLEWYFEEHLTFPFTEDVRARRAAESLRAYGESLFKQIFADPGALSAYQQARQHGLHTLQFEI